MTALGLPTPKVGLSVSRLNAIQCTPACSNHSASVRLQLDKVASLAELDLLLDGPACCVILSSNFPAFPAQPKPGSLIAMELIDRHLYPLENIPSLI